jgi:hypothetical protein
MSTSNYTAESNYQKINRFFVEQIQQLETPIIDDRPNCVSVGPYRVITNGKIYEIWRSRSYLYDFYRRSWGVGYALCLYRGDNRVAAQLIEFNKQYVKLDEERYIYKHHISNSLKRQDYDRAEMLECRLSRVDSELFGLEKQVETVLKNIHIG